MYHIGRASAQDVVNLTGPIELFLIPTCVP